MALLPSWFSASTKQVAEKALERNILKYPGLCYIEESQSLAWVTIDNKLKYVNGDDQITDVKYVGKNLEFYSMDKLLYSYDISISEDTVNEIIQNIKDSLNLAEYIKRPEVTQLLDDIVGNLGDHSTVVDYINSLSYNNLSDVPIVNLIGSLSAPVYISSLDNGVYKIKGRYVIGGDSTTVHSSSDEILFLVTHEVDQESGSSQTILTQVNGKSILLYFINEDGSYETDKYITESWIDNQGFMSAESVKEYVNSIIEDTVIEIIDARFDERLDGALEQKIGGINSEDLQNLFLKEE